MRASLPKRGEVGVSAAAAAAIAAATATANDFSRGGAERQ